MTAIQIKYLEYLESKRKNRANEALTASQIQVERDKLAETIANNLRNYKVNVSKNQITKLANDQLNDRELKKLTETIRSNLTQENLRLQQNLETERSNKASEKIKQYEAEIQNNKMLIDSMNSGKSNTIFGKLFDWMRGSINAELISGGQVLDKTGNLGFTRANQVTDTLNAGTKYLMDNGIISTIAKANPITNAAYEFISGKQSARQRKKEEEQNEIPTDFSNSKGPGVQVLEHLANKTNHAGSPKGVQLYDKPIGPTLPTNRINAPSAPTVVTTNVQPQNSVTTNNTSKAHSGSAIIYSPGSKVGPGWL